MNWGVVRMALQLLQLQAQQLVRSHRTRLQLLALLLLLHRAWRPLLRRYALRLHRALAAETPRLHYRPTPENQRLLEGCPAITHGQYYPPWQLFNGHLQTVQLSREHRYAFPSPLYERQTIDTPDGGILSLDWALPSSPDGSTPRVSALDPSKPTMLLLPGLTGGSGEFYIRCVVHAMLQRGWQVAVLNARGCADTPVKTAQLFCCAHTADLRFVLSRLRDQYDFVATSALVAVGFSMGSNVLVKYLGEQEDGGERTVSAAVSVGNPFDLVHCAAHLKSSPFYRATYDRALTRNLHELFFIKSNAHEAFRLDPRVSLPSVRSAATLTEFDDRLTRRIFDYDSVHAYYYDASSARMLPRVKVPLLCLNAEDDPITGSGALPYTLAEANPHVLLCVTKRGGHLAFYDGEEEEEGGEGGEPQRVRSWAARVVAQFAHSVWTTRTNEP